MIRRLPPLNSLKAFEAPARLESVSAAADELCVTHGAVSRHVQQLEHWLGHLLFVRHNRKVVLTPQGRAYLSEISAAFDRIALATSEQMQARRQQILRVNAPTTFSLRWLLPRLSSFQLANPAIEIRLTTSNEPIGKTREEVDLWIRGGPQDVEGYAAREFLSEVRLPVCSPRVLKAEPLRNPRDLARHTLLHAATYPTMWSEWLAASGNARLKPRNTLTLEHFYLTLQAALDGLGVAMGPVALVADDVAEGRLVFPFDGPVLPPWRYFTYVAKHRSGDDAIRVFQAWLSVASRFDVEQGR